MACLHLNARLGLSRVLLPAIASRSASATFFLDNSTVRLKFDSSSTGGTCCTSEASRATTAALLGFGRGVVLLLGQQSLLADDLLVEFLARTRENFFDVLSSLGASLEALVDGVLSGKLDGAVKVDLTCALELTLVTDQVDTDILSGVLLDLLQPTSQVFKCLVPGNIIGQKDAVGTSVKDPCH